MTFDNGDQGVYDYALPLLNTYIASDGTTWKAGTTAIGAAVNGMAVTNATCEESRPRPSGPGYWNMNWTELQNLLTLYGWSIYNETWDHLCALNCSNAASELGNNQNGVTLTLPSSPGLPPNSHPSP